MSYKQSGPYGRAQEHDDDRTPRPKQQTTVLFTAAGERVPPIHKPFKRAGCVWVHDIGWVWNPTRREIA